LREIEEKKQIASNPDFWANPDQAEVVMKSLRLMEKKVSLYHELTARVDDVELEFEIFNEGESSEEAVDKCYFAAQEAMEEVEVQSTLSNPEDTMSCILQINAGAGGTESCDWSAMLYRMYLMWAQKNGYKVLELNRQDGDVAGIKSVELEIEGDFAYGMLKGENGVHRLVRVSPFNSQGKRMTSFSSVFVHPLVDDTIEIDIKTDDLEYDFFRASGAGGQHVNKTESAVRIRHLPSGVVVECQQERSQHQNREKAMQMLRSMLYELELKKQQAERDKVESGKMKNEWGSQIRSYVLDDRWVKDLRTGFKSTNPDAVLAGDINGFLKAFLMYGNKEVVEED
jgi:peptide chain release factor 2